MKSYVMDLSRLYRHLFADAVYIFPSLRREFERDLARLEKFVAARGLPTYTVDLPAVGKHLDRCLSTGQYIASGLPLTQRYSRKVVIPKFLRGLYLLVFHEDGCLRDDYSLDAVIFLRQFYNCAKKVTVGCSDEATRQEVAKFLAADRALPRQNRRWTGAGGWEFPSSKEERSQFGFRPQTKYFSFFADYGNDLPGSHPTGLEYRLTENLDMVVKILCRTLGDFCPSRARHKHGPGAVSERTGPVNKYEFVNWSDRLERVYPIADHGFVNHAAWAAAAESEILGLVPGIGGCDPVSRLVAVPKTHDKPRLIAAEPTEHQWCQQSIWHYFRESVSTSWLYFFLRFDSQELNQGLCVKGSESGALCTLDLSSASDCVTCDVVESMFWRLPKLLECLYATRTRAVDHSGITGDEEPHMLRKFSTMGSAVTFPVESLIFLSVALAATLLQRGQRVTEENIRALKGEVAVFGDDIILPTDAREACVSLLNLLWFNVNTNKSFWEGNFRESCGVDAFHGDDVTPVYWRGPNTGKPESVAMTVAVANNFYKRGYCNSATYMASTVRRSDAPYVSARSGVFGLQSRVLPDPRTLYKVRWNRFLHREEVLVPQLIGRVDRVQAYDDTTLLQYFTEQPSPLEQWASGWVSRHVTKITRQWVAVDSITG